MLNYIVCENDKEFRDGIKKQIETYMMRVDIDYEIYTYKDYGKEFEEIANKDIGFKMYLLDIKTGYGTGIDAARYIRESIRDWNALIVIITAFSEYRYEALGNRLGLLDFISKIDNCKKKVEEAIEIGIMNYRNRHKSLSYEYNHTIYKIEYRNILYIEKEQESKRCEIHTNHGNYKVPMSLVEIEEQIDNRFIKVHRSMIVNTDKIEAYDMKGNTITFSNGQTTSLIARSKRKELIKHVTASH